MRTYENAYKCVRELKKYIYVRMCVREKKRGSVDSVLVCVICVKVYINAYEKKCVNSV